MMLYQLMLQSSVIKVRKIFALRRKQICENAGLMFLQKRGGKDYLMKIRKWKFWMIRNYKFRKLE